MTSNQYCGRCGSFDLVTDNPDWISRRMLNTQSRIYCYGCDKTFSPSAFAKNAIRTVPLTYNDFFFQTNIRNGYLTRKQIKPFAQALGVSLIVIAVAGLLLFELPGERRNQNWVQIEWADRLSAVTETDVVKELQFKFDQLVRAK